MTCEARFSEQEIEQARILFSGPCTFLRGVVAIDGLPPDDRAEVAFAGRSNVGKSSLLNALTNRKGLARTSNTPGRTRELNFFELGETLRLVDLPGYGYARVSKKEVGNWTGLIKDYLRGRPSLRRVFVLIDARHGVKSSDAEIFDILDIAAVPYQILLTKIDKIKPPQLSAVEESVAAAIAKRPAAHPYIHATSSEKRLGFEELRADIMALTLH